MHLYLLYNLLVWVSIYKFVDDVQMGYEKCEIMILPVYSSRGTNSKYMNDF